MIVPKEIRAAIIDDEKKAIDTLQGMINEYCNEIQIVGTGNTVKEGIDLVDTEKPHLVFLDIDMTDGYGFDVIQRSSFKEFNVVFTTAYSSYAARAFEFAAIHYLLKPINIDALIESIQRHKRQQRNVNLSRIDVLKDSFQNKISRITVQLNDEYEVVDLDDILYMRSDEGITIVARTDGKQQVVSQSLTHFENLLSEQHFFRCHSKYLVNLKKVSKYSSLGRSGAAKLIDGTKLQVAARRKSEFARHIKKISA